MCCFSGPARVADTRIFARSAKEGRQFLAYAMRMTAKDDLAMILPIPTPKDSKDNAVRFINLEKYPEFFEDMDKGFPKPKSDSRGPANGAFGGHKLEVVSVGCFEASFVPAIKDFPRLDERFRLPQNVWDRLPAYKNYGFAVFKLKKGTEQKVHPMAFEFPRDNPEQLFFPTVHIHDGKVHPRARFDHALYCQPDKMLMRDGWVESLRNAGMFLKADQSAGLIDPEKHCYKKDIVGTFENGDMVV